ncbi:hypothetical protein WI99_03980 [Burkholderia cepacia]|nr:hypothetical protein [Burkholderia cepacia]KVE90538.1 hypothetical protein WI99_03980 [Burkholderia cepacia]
MRGSAQRTNAFAFSVAIDDDRARANLGKLRGFTDRRAERHDARRFAADADDRGRTARVEREHAEQLDRVSVVVGFRAEELRACGDVDRRGHCDGRGRRCVGHGQQPHGPQRDGDERGAGSERRDERQEIGAGRNDTVQGERFHGEESMRWTKDDCHSLMEG